MKTHTEKIEELEGQIEELRKTILSHNKLFRIMNNKFKSIEEYDFESVTKDIREMTPEPVLGKVINLYNNK